VGEGSRPLAGCVVSSGHRDYSAQQYQGRPAGQPSATVEAVRLQVVNCVNYDNTTTQLTEWVLVVVGHRLVRAKVVL